MSPFGLPLPGGLFVVVYPRRFEWLMCDHHEGTIAVDLFNSKGEFFDGIVACPLCLDAALEFVTTQMA